MIEQAEFHTKKKWNIYYVYKITNLINGMFYFGKTPDMQKRFQQHIRAAKTKRPGDYFYLHRAINKYGAENFVIEKMAEFSTDQESKAEETRLITLHNTIDRNIGYNLTKGGDGASGYRHTEKAKKAMSAHKQVSYLGEGNPFYGRNHTEITKDLISKLMIERQANDREKYDAINIAQCKIQLGECLQIQHEYIEGNVSFDTLAKLHNSDLRTIHNIIHGIYKAIKGHSIITEEQFGQIKKKRLRAMADTYLKFDKAQEKQIASDAETMTLSGLCQKYEASEPTIKKALSAHGVKALRNIFNKLEVEEIRAKYASGNYTRKNLVDIYGSSLTTISSILKGRAAYKNQ